MATPTKTTSKTNSKTTSTTQTTKAGKANPAAQAGLDTAAADRAKYFKQYQALFNSFFPGSRADDMKQIQSFYPDYSGNILTDVQLGKNAQQQVGGIVNPLLANIGGIYQARGRQGTGAINALTDVYTGRMKKWSDQVGTGLDAGVAQGVGLGASLANFTRDRNAQLQGDLKQTLGTIGGIDAMGAPNEALGDNAATGIAALGTSTDQRMLQEANAAKSFAGAQPGFAAQEGIQQLGSFQAGLTGAMQQDIGDIRARMPELVNQVYNNLLSNNNAQRTLKANRGATMVGALGDADTRRLNANIARSTIAENLAQMSGQSVSDWLTALTSGSGTTTTTSTTESGDPTLPPGQRLAGAQSEYVGKLMETGRKSKFLDAAGKPSKYAVYHPGLVRKEIEKQLRARATGDLPANMVRFYANRVMSDLGLPSTLPKAAGGSAPNPDAGGGGIDWGNLGGFLGDNPAMIGAGVLPGGVPGAVASSGTAASWIYDKLFG